MTTRSGQPADDLRVGLVGFGLRAGLWRHFHRPGEGSRIVAVCDTSERGRRDAAAALPEAMVTGDLDELIGCAPDAAAVLTPDDTHAAVAVPLLRAGIATFCEKPLDITVEAADRLLLAAQESRTRLYVGHNMRHMTFVRTMKELIDRGEIGDVKAVWCRHFVGNGGDYYFKDWHADRSHTTGLLLQKGAHDIDIIHLLAGGTSRRVTAMGTLSVYGGVTDRRDNSERRMEEWFDVGTWPAERQSQLNPVVDVEDLSMVLMELDNGVLASYQQCHFTPDYWRNYTVIGTRGRIENEGDQSGGWVKLWNRRIDGYGEPDLKLEIPSAEGDHGGADPALVAEFLHFVRTGETTRTNPVEAREAVATGVVATQSLRDGGGARLVPPVPSQIKRYFADGQPGSLGRGSR